MSGLTPPVSIPETADNAPQTYDYYCYCVAGFTGACQCLLIMLCLRLFMSGFDWKSLSRVRKDVVVIETLLSMITNY